MCYQKILLFKFFGNTLYINQKKQNPFYYIKIAIRTFKKVSFDNYYTPKLCFISKHNLEILSTSVTLCNIEIFFKQTCFAKSKPCQLTKGVSA